MLGQNYTISTFAGNGLFGFSGDNGPATSAELSGPPSVAVDEAGNVYIADTFNNCIRKVSGGVITTVAGNRTAGFSGDNFSALGAELFHPYGVAVSAGNITSLTPSITASARSRTELSQPSQESAAPGLAATTARPPTPS